MCRHYCLHYGNHPHSNNIEAILQVMFTTISIFLSDKDMIDMINNKVTPKLSEKAHKDYFGFISKFLNELEGAYFI